MEYKLIAFDMDGTLLQSDKTMSQNVIEAIHYAHKNNKEIVISTGRCLPECLVTFNSTPEVRYAIVGNGAFVYDNHEKKVIYANLIDENTMDQLIQISNKDDVEMHILDLQCVIQKSLYEHVDLYGMSAYKQMYTEVAILVDNLDDYYKENRTPIQKVNFYHQSEDEQKKSLEKMKNLPLSIKAVGTLIECTAPNVNKGNSFKKLCEYLNIDLSQTIAVGDSINDIDMLKAAGLSIAMKNASMDAKEICDAIVDDNDHDGCAEAINKYLL